MRSNPPRKREETYRNTAFAERRKASIRGLWLDFREPAPMACLNYGLSIRCYVETELTFSGLNTGWALRDLLGIL